VFSPQPTQVQCPQCKNPAAVSLQSIIDVGQQPELKERLLRGRLNIMNCSVCKASGMVATPLLYHDPSSDLLLAFVPMQLGLKMVDQEKTIGALTNALMSQIPAEQRKGYLLQPNTVFSIETLIEEILRADGITPEMMEAQNHALRLIHDLLAAKDDEEQLRSLVEEHSSEIDYEFLLLLSSYTEAVHDDGNQALANALVLLREKLVDLTGLSAPSPPSLGPAVETRDEFIDLLLSAPDKDAIRRAVAIHRPLADYAFFQQLTGQIESAQAGGDGDLAKRLTNLRQQVLEISDQLDREAQAELEGAAKLLQEIVESPDLEQAIRARADQMNEAFLVTLAANISAAHENKREDLADAFQNIYAVTLRVLEERLPPELRLVNQLMREESPEARGEQLQAQRAMITPEFLELVEALAQDSEAQGQAEAAQRLRQIGEQAAGHQ